MDNVGGLYRIFVCPVGNLTDTGQVTDKAKLIPVVFTEGTGERKCTRKSDKTGVYYDLVVTCIVPRSEKGEQLAESFPVEFVLVTIDNNGVTRLDGSADEPISVETESETGEDFKDLNAVTLKFTRRLVGR